MLNTPKGFTYGGIHAGVRKNPNKKDLAIIYCEKTCNAAALFTTNKVKAAPVLLAMEHIKDGKAQAVVVNSGNANACTATGAEIASQMCEITAKELNISKKDVIVASTGVIGAELPIAPFEKGIPDLAKAMSAENGNDLNAAADAIMTTDTFAKKSCAEFELDGKRCLICGIAKGSGMIYPNMATMLAFITTDADIESELLEKALREVNDDTFNMVSVDGDTSTNDMVCVMASGLSGITVTDGNYDVFVKALRECVVSLAKDMAKDGEGATKLISCTVEGAKDINGAKAVAKAVVSSSLVKAAMSAADANWGRILCAIGYSDCDVDVNKICVAIGSANKQIPVCNNGVGIEFSEDEAFKLLSENEIQIRINLNGGNCEATAWGCDLTAEYVRINADYRS